MTRLIKLIGLASVYLMMAPCVYTKGGFSVIPNIGNPFGAFPNPLNLLGL
jgi:hypothetical protein